MWMVSIAVAGGWTQPAGEGYAKVGYRVVPGLPGSSGFGLGGESVELAPYADHQLQAYAELGFTDTWTGVIQSAPLGLAAYDGDRAWFVGPSRLGVRRALTRGSWKTAVEVLVGGTPPVGDRDLAPEPDVVFQGAAPTAQAQATLQVGRGLGRWWIAGEAGLRAQSALHEVFVANLQVGRQWERVTVDVHVPVGWALGRLEEPLNYVGSGDTRYVGFGVGVGVWLTDHVGLATGFEGAPYAEANARSLTLPLFLQLR